MSEPYYEPYVVRHPLDYGMARAYSGGYIGPGASKVSTVSGFFFLNRLSFNSSAPFHFASSAAPSCLSPPLLQPAVLPPPAPTLSFSSSPLPAPPPALCPLSALCPFLSPTAPSPTLSSSSHQPPSPLPIFFFSLFSSSSFFASSSFSSALIPNPDPPNQPERDLGMNFTLALVLAFYNKAQILI